MLPYSRPRKNDSHGLQTQMFLREEMQDSDEDVVGNRYAVSYKVAGDPERRSRLDSRRAQEDSRYLENHKEDGDASVDYTKHRMNGTRAHADAAGSANGPHILSLSDLRNLPIELIAAPWYDAIGTLRSGMEAAISERDHYKARLDELNEQFANSDIKQSEVERKLRDALEENADLKTRSYQLEQRASYLEQKLALSEQAKKKITAQLTLLSSQMNDATRLWHGTPPSVRDAHPPPPPPLAIPPPALDDTSVSFAPSSVAQSDDVRGSMDNRLLQRERRPQQRHSSQAEHRKPWRGPGAASYLNRLSAQLGTGNFQPLPSPPHRNKAKLVRRRPASAFADDDRQPPRPPPRRRRNVTTHEDIDVEIEPARPRESRRRERGSSNIAPSERRGREKREDRVVGRSLSSTVGLVRGGSFVPANARGGSSHSRDVGVSLGTLDRSKGAERGTSSNRTAKKNDTKNMTSGKLRRRVPAGVEAIRTRSR